MGNPMLQKGTYPDEFFDDDGARVNIRGYLVDKDGNVIG